MVAYIIERHPDQQLSDAEKMTGTSEFFRLLSRSMPNFRLLEDVRNSASPPLDMPTTGGLRERLGGDISMRGVGMSLCPSH